MFSGRVDQESPAAHITRVVPQANIDVSACFCEMWLGRDCCKSQSERPLNHTDRCLSGGRKAPFLARKKLENFFWRIPGIAILDNYPEKTDRLEQRRRRGNPHLPRFSFCSFRDLVRRLAN